MAFKYMRDMGYTRADISAAVGKDYSTIVYNLRRVEDEISTYKDTLEQWHTFKTRADLVCKLGPRYPHCGAALYEDE